MIFILVFQFLFFFFLFNRSSVYRDQRNKHRIHRMSDPHDDDWYIYWSEEHYRLHDKSNLNYCLREWRVITRNINRIFVQIEANRSNLPFHLRFWWYKQHHHLQLFLLNHLKEKIRFDRPKQNILKIKNKPEEG